MSAPIRLRLGIASCAVFLVVIAGLELGAYYSVRAAIHSIVDHELETRLAGLDDHLTRHIPHISWPQLSASLKEHPAFQPDLLLIRSADGNLLMEGRGIRGAVMARAGRTPAIETLGAAGRALRVLSVRRKIDGNDYDLMLGTDLQFSAEILSRLWLVMVLSIPGVVLVSAGASYWISGRALAPVSNLISAARSIDPSRLNERIGVPATGDEIQQLAETMNAMLSRIEQGFDQVREFTANASHELRTPLAVIRAHAEVALLDRSDRGGRGAQEALRKILTEAERDSALIENLLQIARADAGIGRMRPVAVDLGRSLTQACQDVRPLAESKGVALRVTTAAGEITCEGVEEQLRRLWIVLLDNAVKFTPAGGRVSARCAMSGDGYPLVEVEDTGIGIAGEHHARIFERFYRIDKARSRSMGGAGLGLAIAQQIAMQHGAAIDVESAPGQGSRFTVTFRARRATSHGKNQHTATPVLR